MVDAPGEFETNISIFLLTILTKDKNNDWDVIEVNLVNKIIRDSVKTVWV